MIVAGVDPSLTNTGIAVLLDGHPILLHASQTESEGKSYRHRSNRIVAQTRSILETLILAEDAKPDLVVIEGPAYANNNAYTHDQSGLWWGIYSTLIGRRHQIPVVIIAPTTLKLWVTGDGHATKTQVLDTVKTWYPNHCNRIGKNDNIADALGLAAAGAFHVGDPIPFEIKPRHTTNLEAVKWPVLVRSPG